MKMMKQSSKNDYSNGQYPFVICTALQQWKKLQLSIKPSYLSLLSKCAFLNQRLIAASPVPLGKR